MGNSDSGRPIISGLEDIFSVCAINRSGHGQSGPSADLSDPCLANNAQDIRAVLRYLIERYGIKHFVIMGHSLGGSDASEIEDIYRKPGIQHLPIAGLILICSSFDNLLKSFLSPKAEWLVNALGDPAIDWLFSLPDANRLTRVVSRTLF